MKILNKSRKQRGVGLIEILIVLVVLVIAWAAIAALQGTLMSGSSTTKARNEALELAREKTEEFRTMVEKSQYLDDLQDTGGSVVFDTINNPIQGVNATFTRSWILDDWPIDAIGADEDYAKKLVMQVSWVNNEGVTENVVLNSMITFSNKLAIASFATGGTGDTIGTPVPNTDTASEGPGTIDPITELLDEIGDGDSSTDDNIYTAVDTDGNLVVYQGAAINGEFENGLTVYGGKILKIAGTIYFNSPTPYVQATSPAFCATFVRSKDTCGIDDSSPTNCAEYFCYTGGDCKNGGDGCGTQEERDALPDLNGGWWGKVGDFFPTLDNATQFPTICMGDSINLAARLYVSKRTVAEPQLNEEGEVVNTGIEREGINTSFDCQDVIISAANDSACASMIEELTGYEILIDPNTDPSGIEDNQVIRELDSGDTNDVLAATNNDYYNGVFSNFCSNEIPPTNETYYEYECTCSWNKRGSFVESVVGVRSDGIPQTGCCVIDSPGCDDNVPDPVPNNLKEFTYSCSTDPNLEPIINSF